MRKFLIALLLSLSTSMTYAQKANDLLIENQGFSFESLWKGVLGMIVLLILAFLFSSNRKQISWKTVGIGLSAQLLLAIGVLKVPFIRSVFEFLGKIFVKILDYTRAGSEFLFGSLMNEQSFGFVFVFQILPTIIFFSALTFPLLKHRLNNAVSIGEY